MTIETGLSKIIGWRHASRAEKNTATRQIGQWICQYRLLTPGKKKPGLEPGPCNHPMAIN
jgi:hypothetical protein